MNYSKMTPAKLDKLIEKTEAELKAMRGQAWRFAEMKLERSIAKAQGRRVRA